MAIRHLLATAQVECVTFTLAHALAQDGAQVDILPFPGALAQEVGRWYLAERIGKLPRVSVVDAPRGDYASVVYEAGHARPDPGLWRRTLRASSRLAVVMTGYEGDPLRRWKASLGFCWRHREILAVRPRFAWIAHVPRKMDATSLLGRRAVLPVDVHANFLCDEELHASMFDASWSPEDVRAHPLNYVGSEEPAVRKAVLRQMADLLARRGIVLAAGDSAPPGSAPWRTKGDVRPADYCRLLGACDFTLCPPGFVGWTHRVMEALCRGSIPILPKDTAPFYPFPLVHGETALLVEDGAWGDAVAEALDMPPARRVRMRGHIAARRSDLADSACSAAIRRAVGA